MTTSWYHRSISTASKFVAHWHVAVAALLLSAMFLLSFGAMRGDSPIVDEVPHIAAGYSYLHYGDYRLNPEHPPLIKDLAGLPLQFMGLAFPDTLAPWTTDVNGQWESGWSFLYRLGNDASAIVFWARLPVLLLAIATGVVLYRFCYRRFGKAAALLALTFYAFSPNFLAHSHYVTTDLGASAFIMLALIAFIRFTESPTRTTIALLGFALAFAQIAKFSSVLLYPFLGVMTLAIVLLGRRSTPLSRRFLKLVGGFLGASVLSLGLIWAMYAPHTAGMSNQTQDKLINGSLYTAKNQPLKHELMKVNDVPGMKPLVQYVLGIAMVQERVKGGNVTFFNGQVSNQSFRWYFPELFLLKTQVPFLILGIITVTAGLAVIFRRQARSRARRVLDSWRTDTMEWVLTLFAVFYFGFSVSGNLNLGIRHILPIYLPLFVVVSVAVVRVTRRILRGPHPALAAAALALLVGSYVASALVSYPSYTSYFNVIAGGSQGGGKYFSDSSVDWGQDLLRFKAYVDDNPQIDHIALDYFGGAITPYYFCRETTDGSTDHGSGRVAYDCTGSKVSEWHSANGTYTGQYLAVSQTFLESDVYYAPLTGITGYGYLRAMTPIAKVGGSIYVYKLY